MAKKFEIPVQEDENGDLFIQFPDEVLVAAGWQTGDTINWEPQGDGSFVLTKQETEWVLVECINTFRLRYMVEVPKGKTEYALDTVTCEDAKEFSQECIGEQIVSHRPVTMDEALVLCDKDNDYTKEWTDAQKVQTFFTNWKEQQTS